MTWIEVLVVTEGDQGFFIDLVGLTNKGREGFLQQFRNGVPGKFPVLYQLRIPGSEADPAMNEFEALALPAILESLRIDL